MPVIENLKNFIRERHNNHHNHHHNHNQHPQQAQQTNIDPNINPPSTKSNHNKIHHHHHHHQEPRILNLEIAPLKSNHQPPVESSSSSSNQSSAIDPQMTAAASQPVNVKQQPQSIKSINITDNSPSANIQSTSPILSPSSAAGLSSSAIASHGEQAEALIERARAEKSKMPTYEGLPDHFTLIQKMGDGAFSNVYKAIDRRTGQKVAIKCVRKFELNRNQDHKHLNADLKKKPRATERANILKEVSIMRTLNHPNIVKLINFTESREHYFLVLELMEGGELFHQIVKLTYFSEELARHVILQVARGIRYLHEEKGVVHRDIKPENLLFEAIPIIPSKSTKQRPYDEEKEDEGEFLPNVGGGGIGHVKIADFGLSKIVWAEDTATPCGTVGYTAPEIVKDERYSKSVDMWAMGCVLYTLLCGFPPFFDESIQVLTEKVARGYYTFLSPWWDDISDSSKDLISHLLCVDPEKRYTIDEFLAHPWCKEKAPAPQMNRQDVATMAPHIQKAKELNYAPRDSPLLHAAGGGRTPGIAQLREAFDVTYAVHRMEEESARQARFGGAANVGVLHGLNEEDEDEDEDEDDDDAPNGFSSTGNYNHRTQGHYQGRGGADVKIANAALYSGQAGTRDRGLANGGRGAGKKGRNSVGGGFELNIGQATLLGRRNKIN